MRSPSPTYTERNERPERKQKSRMATITLHRASRVLEAIQKALKANEPKASAKVSIFSPDLRAELEGHRASASRALEATQRLLGIRAEIRAAVGRANGESGISALLARKSSVEDMVAAHEALPGVAPAPKVEAEDEFAAYRRRHKKVAPPAVLNVTTAVATAEAMRARYQGAAAEGAAAEIEVGTASADDVALYRRSVVALRRELDEISEGLRGLNASVRIEVADADMDWLTTNDVV